MIPFSEFIYTYARTIINPGHIHTLSLRLVRECFYLLYHDVNLLPCLYIKKVNRKCRGVPQSQATANPRQVYCRRHVTCSVPFTCSWNQQWPLLWHVYSLKFTDLGNNVETFAMTCLHFSIYGSGNQCRDLCYDMFTFFKLRIWEPM